jgi:hypothetical protein
MATLGEKGIFNTVFTSLAINFYLGPGYFYFSISVIHSDDRLCGLVVRVPGYKYRGPGSIHGVTRFYEKWV